jgi:hypothetical protein
MSEKKRDTDPFEKDLKQNNSELLNRDISSFGASEEFLYMSNRNSFLTLGDLLQFSVPELMNRPLMNYRMLAELSLILKNNGLLGLLREEMP